MRYLKGARNECMTALRENWTSWIGLQVPRTVWNNVTTMSPRVLARLDAFRRANGKVSAARRNARVRPRGHLIASMVNGKAAL